MSDLSQEERADTIRSIVGLVKRLYGEELPDDFNVEIRVRGRFVKRLDIHPVVDEVAIVEHGVRIK
jgi:hypothetical protein